MDSKVFCFRSWILSALFVMFIDVMGNTAPAKIHCKTYWIIFYHLCSQWSFLPSPGGGSSLFCCSLLEEEEEDEGWFVVAWDRTVNRSFSININFLFRASISFSLRRSSIWTSVKPSSHSLLISATAALASISMMEDSLLWKAPQLSMLSRISTSASRTDVKDVQFTFYAGKSRKCYYFGRCIRHCGCCLKWKNMEV